MSTEHDDGGQAFPQMSWEYDGQNNVLQFQYPGMTLRDYFAAKALEALIAKGMDNTSYRNAKGVPVIAKFAYEYADAMLKARKA